MQAKSLKELADDLSLSENLSEVCNFIIIKLNYRSSKSFLPSHTKNL